VDSIDRKKILMDASWMKAKNVAAELVVASCVSAGLNLV
jgi:hypothetical protein